MRGAIAYRCIMAKFAAGDYDGALRRLRALRSALPTSYSLFCDAFIRHYSGRVEEAEPLYRVALAKAQSGTGSPCGPLYYSLGRALEDLGRFEEAREFLNQAIA